MIIYLDPTSKTALKYSSKISGIIVNENESTVRLRNENGLDFLVPRHHILKKITDLRGIERFDPLLIK